MTTIKIRCGNCKIIRFRAYKKNADKIAEKLGINTNELETDSSPYRCRECKKGRLVSAKPLAKPPIKETRIEQDGDIPEGVSPPVSSYEGVVSTPQKTISYVDYSGLLEKMKRCYDQKLFMLIIGPKGTGKTQAILKFAQEQKKEVFTINCSLRTREHHLIGHYELENGQSRFVDGALIRSMKTGGILYLDEINQAEADVLIRLSEALDDRRQVHINGYRINANQDWWVVASINPLQYTGTKELPPQILSRFPVRINVEYPPSIVELEILKANVETNGIDKQAVKNIVMFANELRKSDIAYAPSIRETIASVKLMQVGYSFEEAITYTMIEGLKQYSEEEYIKAKEIFISLFKTQGVVFKTQGVVE